MQTPLTPFYSFAGTNFNLNGDVIKYTDDRTGIVGYNFDGVNDYL